MANGTVSFGGKSYPCVIVDKTAHGDLALAWSILEPELRAAAFAYGVGSDEYVEAMLRSLRAALDGLGPVNGLGAEARYRNVLGGLFRRLQTDAPELLGGRLIEWDGVILADPNGLHRYEIDFKIKRSP